MSKVLKIAFLGSRGIPVKYGGAESFIEEVSKKLLKRGFKVYVTCESKRFYKDEYDGIVRIHSPAIEGKSLTIPTLNDFFAVCHLLLRCPDVDLIYYAFDASPAVAILRLLGKKIVPLTGGIEWQRLLIRKKYFSPGLKLISIPACLYLRLVEWLATKVSHAVIADSRAIKAYLERSYKAKNIVYISYGARELINSEISAEKEYEVLSKFGLTASDYYLTVGRIVAENGMHKEIEGFKKSDSTRKLVIVGNFNEKDGYSRYLLKLRNNDPGIIFLDPIFDKEELGILRKNCFAYIHAYEVGGTNPSLLEQMPFQKPIIAYDVPFHREVLQEGGIYFKDADDQAECIRALEACEFDVQKMGELQARRIKEEYNWDNIAEKYCELFRKLIREKREYS